MTTALHYVEQHTDRFVEELLDFIRIPSVSTQPEHVGDIRRAASWIADHCRNLGMTRVEIFETPGHPIVYGEWLEAGNAPTVLIYGHYDVQPAEAADGWHTADPFVPEIRNGNIVARGATDDKGQLFIHVKVFETFMKTAGRFPINVKVLFEGEEEASSLNLGPFIKAHQELLKADVAVISDSSMFAPGIPAIPYGMRGLVITELEIAGPKSDLHSGSYGGTVHNPIHALSQLIARMHDVEGHVTVPGFYDRVRQLDALERAHLAQVPYTEEKWRDETGAPQPWGEPGFSLLERIGARPTLEVTSIRGGFIGDGLKNIVPQKARAILTCRLVPDQDPAEIFELVRQYIETHTPPTVRASLKRISESPAVLVDRHTPMMQTAIQAYKQVCGHEPLFTLGGGSIPVVTDFQEKLLMPTLLMGFGLPDDNLHAPNEKFALEQFRLGLRTMIAFYDLLAQG